MKKTLTFALCVALFGLANAQKANVEQAKKLAGKLDKIEEARTLINEAIANPETSNDALTYKTAGDVEFKAYTNQLARLAINPNDDNVNQAEMSRELINAYNFYNQVLPLDELPNEKGQIKPRFTKEIIGKIAENHEGFFKAGAILFGEKDFYPAAYNAFMIYGDLSSQEPYSAKVKAVPDSVRATAYYNAGLCGWQATNVIEAAKAFAKARKAGYNQPESYIYEIACWQNISKDSTQIDNAKNNIREIAEDGYARFGISQPLFINNLINTLVSDNKMDEAISRVNALVDENPDNANLYGLRAFVFDRAEKDDESVENYRKAASLPDVDFETLKNASKKIFRVGTEKWNNMDQTDKVAKENIKTNYFEAALEMANRANQLHPNDSDVDYIIENITYALNTYF